MPCRPPLAAQAELEAARKQVQELQAQAKGSDDEARGTGALLRQLEAEVAALSTELRRAKDDGAAAASKVRPPPPLISLQKYLNLVPYPTLI